MIIGLPQWLHWLLIILFVPTAGIIALIIGEWWRLHVWCKYDGPWWSLK